MSASYSINCDGCGDGYKWVQTFGPISLQVARRSLRPDGWHAVRRPHPTITRTTLTRDICPDCWDRGIR